MTDCLDSRSNSAEKPKRRSVREVILEMAEQTEDTSFSPGDIAKAVEDERRKPGASADSAHKWARIVREEAIGLARAGHIEILRKGKPVDPAAPIKGVIRLRKANEPASD